MTDQQLLDAFLIDNDELEQLEAALSEFNLFEAVGAVRQELRHSDFLAFLLNPRESHGLDDLLIKKLLQRALQNSDVQTGVSPIEIALWNLTSLTVQREWRHIDILLVDDANKLVVLIENKVGTGEHSNQLQRYWQIVAHSYPDHRVIPLFLTPDGTEPTDDRYLPIDYGVIYELLKQLIKARGSTMGPDVLTTLRHYTQLLRRHIMPDSDIAELCRQIYRKHQKALDLIYEHRPDLQGELSGYLQKLAQSTPEITLGASTKWYIRFWPTDWLSIPALRTSDNLEDELMRLRFGFENQPNKLYIKLITDTDSDSLRQKMFDLAEAHQPLKLSGRATTHYRRLYRFNILTPADYEEALTLDDLSEKIERRWKQFLKHDFPKITQVISSADWDTDTDKGD